jgi:hypothetical protein
MEEQKHFKLAQRTARRIEPKPKESGLNKLKYLELLYIWHYHPKTKNFKEFEFPESVTELEINWTNIESLDFLPSLINLRHLEVHRCRNLHQLTDLGSKYPNLQHFVIDACGKVKFEEGIKAIANCKYIKHAYVQ